MKGKGMLLNNADVLLAMDREPGTYISAKLKKDGTLVAVGGRASGCCDVEKLLL